MTPAPTWKHRLTVVTLLLIAIPAFPLHAEAPEDGQWQALFNGEDIDDWTAKFTGHAVDENIHNTFRVEDGLLIVTYEDWDGSFDNQIGHLFHEQPHSHYRLRAEYRFVGEQHEGAPDWAYRNNGLMMHCQAPESMETDQMFPRSVEAQLLGANDHDQRPTANLCRFDIDVHIDGEPVTEPGCIDSSSDTYRGDTWVTVETEVRGGELVRHHVNGEPVMEYTDLQLEDGTPVTEGYIAIQAESHPTEFRTIEIMPLDE